MNALKRKFAIMAAAICMLALVGCATNPGQGPVVASAVSTPEQMAQQAKGFWLNHNVPPFHRSSSRKVALAELTVEFVTDRLEMARDANLSAPYVRRSTDFGEGLKLELPGMLYQMLEEEGDMNLIAIPVVAEANAYQRLKGTQMGERAISYRLGVVGSDAGRPKQASLYTVDGLRVIDPTQDDVEKISSDLLKELGADVVFRIRLRVGVYQGRATIEAGSVIDVVGPSQVGDLESMRTLISDDDVLDVSAGQAASQPVYTVNSAKFRDAVRRLVVPYLTMAGMATR